MSAERARREKRPVLARLAGWAGTARKPLEFTVAPADAVRRLLGEAGLSPREVDLWEINEAFAVVALANIRLLGLDPARVNVRGGAVVLGHPIGASGARILVTLIHALRDLGGGGGRNPLHRRGSSGGPRRGRRGVAPMNKLCPSAADAIADLGDGATVMVGGFGLCGNPDCLIEALARKGVRHLTLISNNCGTTDQGLGVLLKGRQVRKMVSSYVGENREFERLFLEGELEVELNPQGTLAERIRAGAAGIAGFYTATGVGTLLAEGKETRVIGGRACLLELPLHADFALVKAWRADTWGNLVFRKTARNFNAVMCGAARVTVAEAEEVVAVGELPPDAIHVPSIYVQRVVRGSTHGKPIERRTVRPR